MSANVKSMMYYGEVPWHGLGKALDHPATAKEALVEAGLDYGVELRDLYYREGRNLIKVPPRATVRVDANLIKEGEVPETDYLGTVGTKYRPIQNFQAFEAFDEIVGDGKAIYHTAGCLGSGEKIWILAEIPGEMVIDGKDKITKYLLLYNSHDGSSQVEFRFTPIRVVCQNTLMLALGGKGKSVKFKHTTNADERMKEAGRLLGVMNSEYVWIEKICNELQVKKLDKDGFVEYLKGIFPLPEKKQARALEAQRNVFSLYRGDKNKSLGNTWWRAYNSVVEYVDYAKKYRTDRLSSVWFGSGAELKERAFTKAVEMSDVPMN